MRPFFSRSQDKVRRLRQAEDMSAAVSRSQAMIEFDLSGRILTANANFLEALGYTLEEIRGQHHSLFVTSEYRQSPEYRAFWDKLGRGEFDAGKYKRIAKGGRDIWIQATYNPILDNEGRPYKVVKFATDITAAEIAAGGVVILVESQSTGRFALTVDAILGQRQVVIKSFEANYRHIEGIAAATILGDGRVALILDVDGIVSRCRTGLTAPKDLRPTGT